MPRRLQEKTELQEGQKLKTTISDIENCKRGTTEIHEFLIFTPKTTADERLKAKPVEVERRFALAEKVN